MLMLIQYILLVLYVCVCVCVCVLFVPCFIVHSLLPFLVLQSYGCFTLIVFLLPCGCQYLVVLPHGVVGRSAVCDCGISWS